MSDFCLWIRGTSRSGKSTRLVREFENWVTTKLTYDPSKNSLGSSGVLVFASNNDHRHNLADKLSNAVQGTYPVKCKTPLGFIGDEITLFWPLLLNSLQIKARFPLRLRPETEQQLATKLWRSQLNSEDYQLLESRLVRRLLDLLQLAGASCTPIDNIPQLLRDGLDTPLILDPDVIGKLLGKWRQWCLDRGLLTYGLMYDLYWSCLLPNQDYRQQLYTRYQVVFADDVDDYPAIMRDLFELLLDQGKTGIFTYNPEGKVRQGLNADPEYMEGLSERAQVEVLENNNPQELISLKNPLLSERWRRIQTVSRGELLSQITQVIIQGIETKQVKPEEIVIIAPGLDEIARYSLIEMLSQANIPVQLFNEQRPLNSSPIIRALLTLVTLVYRGLGRLVNTEAIAEMLVLLSSEHIDPVRAGLLADYCYQVDIENPCLLSPAVFQRWDRIGARATQAYETLIRWISEHKQEIQENNISPVKFFSQAIQHFFSNGDRLNYENLAVLREFTETAQHYWEVDSRIRQNQTRDTLMEFIQLIRIGTITANPHPLVRINTHQGKVTLATIFQYRSLGSAHAWQFWLEVGSPLWSKGGAAMLWGAPLFWRTRSGKMWTVTDERVMDQERLERIIKDLQARATERIYLCHSELSVTGTAQIGTLLNLALS